MEGEGRDIANAEKVADDSLVDEMMSDLTHSSHGFELNALRSSQAGGVREDGGITRQALLRRQAQSHQQQIMVAPPAPPRPLTAEPLFVDQESLVVMDRETRELTIDSEGARQRSLQMRLIPEHFVDSNNGENNSIGTRKELHPSSNLYYEGQLLALQTDPFSDPELAQPNSLSPLPAASGWSVVDVAPGSVPPCARSLHSAAIMNGALYVFGGYNGQARVNDFHAFSFANRRWSPVLAAANSGHPPSPRDRHVSVVHGTTFYVFAGFNGTSRTNDFFGFDFTSMTWSEVIPRSGRPPSERHSHAAVVHGNCMYVFGGYDGSYK